MLLHSPTMSEGVGVVSAAAGVRPNRRRGALAKALACPTGVVGRRPKGLPDGDSYLAPGREWRARMIRWISNVIRDDYSEPAAHSHADPEFDRGGVLGRALRDSPARRPRRLASLGRQNLHGRVIFQAAMAACLMRSSSACSKVRQPRGKRRAGGDVVGEVGVEFGE